MKTVGRILIILAAAAVIGGLAYLAAWNSGADLTEAGEGQGRGAGLELEGGSAQPGSGLEGAGRHGRGFGRGLETEETAWLMTVRNLVITVVLVAVVALTERLLRNRRERLAVSRADSKFTQ